MLIILEGPNGSGKSSIAAALNADQTFHAGPPQTSNPFVEWVQPLLPFAVDEYGGSLIVCDRWHVGELVYPDIVGRSSIASPMEVRQISMTLGSMFSYQFHTTPAVIAFVLPPLDVLEERFKSRAAVHWQVTWKQAVDAWAKYHTLASDVYVTSGCTKVILSSDDDVHSFVEERKVHSGNGLSNEDDS